MIFLFNVSLFNIFYGICTFFFDHPKYCPWRCLGWFIFFRNFAKFRPLSGTYRLARNARYATFCNGCAGPIVFQKNPNQFLQDRNGGQWHWSINLALSDRQCLVARILTQGVKRPSTRYCSIVDPSRVNVTPGFLFIKFHQRAILARDRFHLWGIKYEIRKL